MGDIVVISGDASNQKDTGLQDALIDIAKAKHAKVCLDASGGHLSAGIKKGFFQENVECMQCYSRIFQKSVL
ncbi:MAG TPA: hypothetical protein VIK78_21295 [Ruminiclostridium sp.]